MDASEPGEDRLHLQMQSQHVGEPVMNWAERRRGLVATCVLLALVVAGCGSGAEESGGSAAGGQQDAQDGGRPATGGGAPGEGGFELEASFFEELPETATLEGAVAVLSARCDDAAITDPEGCRTAVVQFLETATVTLADRSKGGCAARFREGEILLGGGGCVSAFRLVDAEGRPLDPASLPADGRLPEGAGVAPGAVQPPDETGPEGGGGGGGGGAPRPEEQTPAPVVDEDFFERFTGGDDTSSLKAVIATLYGQCAVEFPEDQDPNGAKRKRCGEQVLEFFKTRPIVLETAEGDGCEATWVRDPDGGKAEIHLSGGDCVANFHLAGEDGKPLDPRTLPSDGRLPERSGIAKEAVQPPSKDEEDDQQDQEQQEQEVTDTLQKLELLKGRGAALHVSSDGKVAATSSHGDPVAGVVGWDAEASTVYEDLHHMHKSDREREIILEAWKRFQEEEG